jgi:GMP synthase (glutamine-hydrolysing)
VHAHFVVHESFEAPGAYENWVRDRGHSCSYSRVYANEPLPKSVEGIDLLVVFGGPQSPDTTTDECAYFDAAAECALILKCVAAGKAVVGICLGAQLMGEALGAKHGKSPEKEIGVFPIVLTVEGKANDKFADFGDILGVGHWHSDMPGLTKDATIIAYSEGCPRQIVEYGNLVYGFQCHMEFTKDVVELLISASENELAMLTGHRFVQRPDGLRANEYDVMNQKLFGFLDKLVAAYSLGKTDRRAV